MSPIPSLSAAALRDRVPTITAIQSLQRALRDGVDTSCAAPATTVPLASGDLHLMPAEAFGFAGTKVLAIAPDNPRRKLDRMQGVYLLMDSETLSPRLIIDGAEITLLRTAATSAAAVDRLADPSSRRLVVFGSGPLARAHIDAMMAIRPIEHVVINARDGYKAEGLAAWAVERGLQARIGQATPVTSSVPEADIVVCATSATDPVFDGSLVSPGAVVVAVGSHDRTRRELDDVLMGRADVYVEDVSTALRHAGDVVQAVESGSLDQAALRTIAELERDCARRNADSPTANRTAGRPAVVKTVGMGWQDLIIAIEAHKAGRRTMRRGERRMPIGGIGRSRRPV